MSKVLIVDDEKDVVEQIGALLNSFGHNVSSALDGEAAIETAKREKPDIILLDLCFPKPGLDGDEILKAIREFDKDVKVILISGLDVKSERLKRAQKLGINKFLSKPINFSELKEVISSLSA